MRLGAPVYPKKQGTEAWIQALQDKTYRAAYCPIGTEASDSTIQEVVQAAKENDIVIAEVGAWSNPISKDEETRKAAFEKCCSSLALADAVGARCCVNIAGSRGTKWDGPCSEDMLEDTYDIVVESIRAIIDAVNPTNTTYTLETMPWMIPHSVESYARIIDAIDRPAFAVHFDPVNLICSPERYFFNTNILEDFVQKLGLQIKSCHGKDILLKDQLTTQLIEVKPGDGNLDYAKFLTLIDGLDPETTLMLEHLSSEELYDQAAQYIRKIAQQIGVQL